jgi:hypothetical protein
VQGKLRKTKQRTRRKSTARKRRKLNKFKRFEFTCWVSEQKISKFNKPEKNGILPRTNFAGRVFFAPPAKY